MFNTLKELFQLLTPTQRRKFYVLQILVVLMAIMELVGIASIGPFMALVADINLIETNSLYKQLYLTSGISNPTNFLFLTGLAALLMLGLASVISVLTTWRLSLYSMQVGTEIADRLYEHYLQQNWLFHSTGSSAQLTKQVATEAPRVTGAIIVPAMQLNTRLVLAVIISVAVISYNPIIALVGLLMFGAGYVVIYQLIKKRLIVNGANISSASTQRFRLMNEGFGGIKDILIMGRNKHFIEQFHQENKILARAQGTTAAFSQVPRYFMELLAFGAMISLVLVLLKLENGELSKVLPVLAVYALAGFKLLPALQQIYGSITTIKGGIAAFESIKPDLVASQTTTSKPSKSSKPSTANALDINQAKTLKLNEITFTYPNKHQPALDNITMQIPINATIGLVGESGSGKSTTIDLILGLLQPDKGKLYLDAQEINASNLREWQQHIGFVPQSIYLSEGSIAENIAFGLSPEEINLEQVKQAAKLAHLDELIASLDKGLDTKVGERGVQLSGGQRQRIGIARALYNQASILVFDEATSALDGITEKIIMDAIHELSGKKTIIMIAHRLKTVQQCDIIYMMDKGKVVAQGTYNQLLENNLKFKEMAEHA
ncbi:ABC transporter ATP-binding protein [Thiopseudomonas acetoxidans]|uniref:ABC transporter ATP-binding protein n=1 Tax=Thiopseudomonas acetoxidans TaxID=3041622 RepID=A0ABT7SRX5_9GAMM|nr:ABC transporter ATP-binding protein [Thiopseudomonas sp. CY1220]MDM7858939.1 ABC transporter ATP-binding protein [Thiopseudomonas sp. CY1220]